MSLLAKHKRLLFTLLFLGVLLALVHVSGLRENFSLDILRHRILENQAWGLALFILLFCLGNLIHLPGLIFLAAAVLTLGRVAGGGVTYLAAVTSCAVTFWSIRLLGGDALRRFDNTIAIRLLGQLDARPIVSVALLRTVFQTVPALNYALALSGVRFDTYMIGSLLGLPLPITLYCLFFDYVSQSL